MTLRHFAVAATLAVLTLPTAASAGTYSVQSCRSATGAPLAARDEAGGWRPRFESGTFAVDSCSGSDPRLIAYAGDNVPVRLSGRAEWLFTPPPGTYVSAFRLDYYGYARPFDGVNQGILGISDSDHGTLIQDEGVGTVGPAVAVAAGRHDDWVVAYASCDGPADRPPCPRDAVHARVVLTRSVIELTDATPPTSGAPGGDAVDAQTWTGVERLTASAADVGGGLASWSLAVDGSERLRGRVDPDSPTCVDAGARLYAVPRPCPVSADLLVDIDARALPTGTHDMTLRVYDAAGNARTVFSGRRTVAAPPVLGAPPVPPAADAPPAAAAAPAAPRRDHLSARWAATRARTLTISYGARPAIRGRLTRSDGAPARGAAIGLFTRTLGRRRAVDAGGVRTRPDGTFTLVLRAGLPSSALELRSRSDPRPPGRATLHLRVRAGLTLHAGRRGRSVLLSGALRGRPLPRQGKLVELQARARSGRWLTFATVRADARGRFRTRYRLRTRRPATVLLRARARATGDYPYATGASGRVRIELR